ncbi:hypothetical protein V6M83_00135, partial [Streptococcus anginosus]|uniref:hypothetical protein n=1 Tax=Streptococcus anginosus TaxID=1328 RepID=UPI002FF22525
WVVRQYAKKFSWSGNHPVDFKEWEFESRSKAIKFEKRLQKGMPLKNGRFNVFSAMAMSLVSSRNQLTLVLAASVWLLVNTLKDIIRNYQE